VLLCPVASKAASFDGTWAVIQVCDTTKEGARGYTWRYDVTIEKGHLVGHRGTASGGQFQFTLEGNVRPDGVARLTGTGVTESPDHNLGFAPRGSPIHFRVDARFAAGHGSGERLGVRRCRFTFTRHSA
jgi:hypothetical protein